MPVDSDFLILVSVEDYNSVNTKFELEVMGFVENTESVGDADYAEAFASVFHLELFSDICSQIITITIFGISLKSLFGDAYRIFLHFFSHALILVFNCFTLRCLFLVLS